VIGSTPDVDRSGPPRARGFPPRYRGGVGLNPFRSRVERRTDIIVVVAALVVITVLVVWGLFGG